VILAILSTALLSQSQLHYPGDGVTYARTPEVPAPLTFVCYGDSIAAGACSSELCANVHAAIAGSRATNEAVSGYTSAQIADCYFGSDPTHCAGFASACGSRECATVLLEGGVNDLKAPDAVTGVVEAATVATMLTVADHALARGHRVVWLDVLPYATCVPGTCPSVTDAHLRATTYNALKAAACASPDRPNRHLLTCVTAYADFEEMPGSGALADAYACADDYIHLKQAGAAALACKVLTALGRPCP